MIGVDEKKAAVWRLSKSKKDKQAGRDWKKKEGAMVNETEGASANEELLIKAAPLHTYGIQMWQKLPPSNPHLFTSGGGGRRNGADELHHRYLAEEGATPTKGRCQHPSDTSPIHYIYINTDIYLSFWMNFV